jgi:hypothetical protein
MGAHGPQAAIHSIIEGVRDRRPGKGRPFGPPLPRLKALTGTALPEKGHRSNEWRSPAIAFRRLPMQATAQSWGWSNGGEFPG